MEIHIGDKSPQAVPQQTNEKEFFDIDKVILDMQKTQKIEIARSRLDAKKRRKEQEKECQRVKELLTRQGTKQDEFVTRRRH